MPEFNLADLFEVVAATAPGRPALVAGPVRRTYAELDARANRFGHYLESRRLPIGTHVGILAYNRVEWLEAMLGCFKARMVPINVNYRYVAPELRYIIANADLEVLVLERPFLGLVDEATEGDGRAPALVVIEDDLRSSLSLSLDPDTVGRPEDVDRGSVGFEAALAAADPTPPGRPRSPDDHYVLYTGGTTGQPKGVVWRQEDIFFAAMGGGGWGGAPIDRPEELSQRIPADDGARAVMLVTAPLMHGNAQWASFSAFFMGGTVVLYTERAYDARSILRLVEDEHVVSVALVGDAMARPIAEAVSAAPPGTYDTSSLLAIGSGGAMLSAAVKSELAETLPGVMIMDRFGASESGAQGAVEHGALGPKFVMGPDTTVLDEALHPLSPGDGRVGRLARSGRIPLCYYKDDAKSAATFPVDDRGTRWSVPGDLAAIEPDGTITVLGRGSASINSGGEKIFPEEVESAIKSHPDVFDAIVVGVPDDRFGERVAALVRLRRPERALSLEDLQDHCRGSIARYKVPRQLLLVDEIPLTAAGKPDGKAARALLEGGPDANSVVPRGQDGSGTSPPA
ncbi:MAG: acyl-CoA synthetase [Acidimicrobiales bacterium]|nr:acyl-CoA synthetase [Acidimicrobiales bacterium]